MHRHVDEAATVVAKVEHDIGDAGSFNAANALLSASYDGRTKLRKNT